MKQARANGLLTAFFFDTIHDMTFLFLVYYGLHNLCDFTKNTKVIFFEQPYQASDEHSRSQRAELGQRLSRTLAFNLGLSNHSANFT